jgi:hypothetical protein
MSKTDNVVQTIIIEKLWSGRTSETVNLPQYPSGEIIKELPELDSIYTDHHPLLGWALTVKLLHEHGCWLFPDIVSKKSSWKPFRTGLDFKILEFAMETGLNQKQLSWYINLIHKATTFASNNEEKFTVESATEAMKLWDLAASQWVPVS